MLWASGPGVARRAAVCSRGLARQVVRRIGEHVDVVTYPGEYTRRRIAPALGPRAELVRLVPGVDTAVFRPGPGAARHIRERHDLMGRKVILCVSRLVTRKGQDTLIRALPGIRRTVPDAVLVIVGDGPAGPRLRKLAARQADGHMVFAGGLDQASAPYYSAADVFAMPCRTRKAGPEAEGLGIVFLEAGASGLPVVVGDSGGAPDTVIDGVTGTVVNATNVENAENVADAVSAVLRDPGGAEAMGDAGRSWVAEHWSWDASAERLTRLLTPGADRL